MVYLQQKKQNHAYFQLQYIKVVNNERSLEKPPDKKNLEQKVQSDMTLKKMS